MKIYNEIPKYRDASDFKSLACINKNNELQTIYFPTNHHTLVSKKDYDYLETYDPYKTYNFPFRIISKILLDILNKYSNTCIDNGILPEYTSEIYELYIVYDKLLINIDLSTWFCNVAYFKKHLIKKLEKELLKIENIEYISFNLIKY